MARIVDGVLGGLSTSTISEADDSSTEISSGEDSNIVFRDKDGKVLAQPASLSEVATIDVYYV